MKKNFWFILCFCACFALGGIIVFSTILPYYQKHQIDWEINESYENHVENGGKFLFSKENDRFEDAVYLKKEEWDVINDKVCVFAKNDSRLFTLNEMKNTDVNQFKESFVISQPVLVEDERMTKADFLRSHQRDFDVLLVKGNSLVITNLMAQSGSMYHVWEDMLPFHYLFMQTGCPNLSYNFLQSAPNPSNPFHIEDEYLQRLMKSMTSNVNITSMLNSLSQTESTKIRLVQLRDSQEFNHDLNRPSIPLLWQVITRPNCLSSHLTRKVKKAKNIINNNHNNNNNNNNINHHDKENENVDRKDEEEKHIYLLDDVTTMDFLSLKVPFDLLCFENGIVHTKAGAKNKWFEPHPSWLWNYFHGSVMSIYEEELNIYKRSILLNNVGGNNNDDNDDKLKLKLHDNILTTQSDNKRENNENRKLLILDRDIYRIILNNEEMMTFLKRKLQSLCQNNNNNENNENNDNSNGCWDVEYLTIAELTKSKLELLDHMLSTDILISPHGYQLLYGIFTKPNSAIIEILNNRHVLETFKFLSLSQNKFYAAIHSQPVGVYQLIPEWILSTEDNMKNSMLRRYARALDVEPDLEELWKIVKDAINFLDDSKKTVVNTENNN